MAATAGGDPPLPPSSSSPGSLACPARVFTAVRYSGFRIAAAGPPPAGDTGSQALGALIATAGVLACQQATAAAGGSTLGVYALLGVLSSVYAVECASVLLQVGYFRYTKRTQGAGRRLLRMAPLHHDLELRGLSEPRIVRLCCIASLAALAACWGVVRAAASAA